MQRKFADKAVSFKPSLTQLDAIRKLTQGQKKVSTIFRDVFDAGLRNLDAVLKQKKEGLIS